METALSAKLHPVHTYPGVSDTKAFAVHGYFLKPAGLAFR